MSAHTRRSARINARLAKIIVMPGEHARHPANTIVIRANTIVIPAKAGIQAS